MKSLPLINKTLTYIAALYFFASISFYMAGREKEWVFSMAITAILLLTRIYITVHFFAVWVVQEDRLRKVEESGGTVDDAIDEAIEDLIKNPPVGGYAPSRYPAD